MQRSTQGLEAQLAQQMEALQKAAVDQAEANRQTQEARKQAKEMEQRMKLQAAQAPQVKEVIVEREVVRQDPALEQAARFRGEMQKTVSEELRAPLTALLDLPRLLVDGLQKPLDDAERGQLEILQERGQEILELIEGLTAMSGLQAGGLKLTKASPDLPTIVQRVVRTLQPRAAARGNRIETDIKPGVAPVVDRRAPRRADPRESDPLGRQVHRGRGDPRDLLPARPRSRPDGRRRRASASRRRSRAGSSGRSVRWVREAGARCPARASSSRWPSGWSSRSAARSRSRARWTAARGSPSRCRSRGSAGGHRPRVPPSNPME